MIYKRLLLLLLLVLVIIDSLLQGQLRLLKPSQGIRVNLHVPLEILQVEAWFTYSDLVKNPLEVFQVERHRGTQGS